MGPLVKKFWRDVKANLGQFLAVTIVIALGGAFFIASFSSYQGVKTSLEQTYTELNFPRYWIRLGSEKPSTLPAGAEARVTAKAVVQFRQGEKLGAMLIGLPPGGPEHNKLKLESGALPGDGQVLVESSFAKFHSVKLGDTLGIKQGEKIYNWVVSGTAASPEFIWPVIDRFVPNPSPRSFAVLYVPERQLIRDITGLNHEILTLENDPRAIMTSLQSQNVKVQEVYSRAEQPSNQVLTLLLSGFGKVAAVLPWLFLLAAALSAFALTSILVKSQASQIRILHYLGFTRWQILIHFLSFSLCTGAIGSLFGVLIGKVLAGQLTGALAGILGLPFISATVHTEIVVASVICSIFSALLGGVLPALQITRRVERSFAEIPNWHRFIPVILRLPLNYLLRDKKSACFGAGVIGLGVCLVVSGYVLYQSVAFSAERQFNEYQAYDLRVKFSGVLKEEVTQDIAKIPSVVNLNPYFELPVVVKAGPREVMSQLVGIRGDMLRLEDRLGKPVTLSGLFLSDGVKQGLDARWTPEVALTAVGGKKGEFPVKGYVHWHFGNQIFAPLQLVQTLAGKKGLNGVYLRVQPGEVEQVKAALFRYPTVTLVDSPRENRKDQESLINFTYLYLRILTIFGVILAASMIFALARVNILGRSREYTTMRILGVGLGKIGLSVVSEYLLLLICGLLLGILAGIALASFLLSRVNSLLSYNLLRVDPKTMLFISLISLLIILPAVITAILNVKRISLTENTRELN